MAEKNREEVVPHLDPWTPRPSANIYAIAPPNVYDKDTGLSSEEYIAALEAKLQRLKGRKGREPCSKDIISGLAQAKETQMKDTIEDSDMQQSNFDQDCCSSADREDSRLAALQRRLQPEQAMSAEELKELLENDELAKLIQDLREQEEMSEQKQLSPNGDATASGR